MPLRTLLNYRNADVTSDLNDRLRDLIGKGVFLGGQVLPVAGTLDVTVPTLGAMCADGMVTLLEGAAETLTLTSGVTQWVLLHAYYVANDVPVAELEVLTTAAYDALSTADQDRRIKLAKVTLAAAASEVTTEDISFTEAEQIDTVTRSAFRGTAATVASLPDYTDPATGVTTRNRPHDIYFIEDERIFYSWSEAGTPSWQPVVSTAIELALDQHKQNQDDGATAPDFFEAQHVLVKHRESLDEGTASLKLHGSDGTDFGTGNALLDEQFPGTTLRRVDVTALSGVVEVPLTGTYYVGTGAFGSATGHFQVATYQDNKALLGTDRGPIRVLSVFRSDNAAELEPVADADALGYYDDPIVKLDFAATADGFYTGNLSVYARVKVTAGTRVPGDEALDNLGVGFVPPAMDVPVVGSAFTEIATSTAEVQQALNALDTAISAVTGGSSGTLKKIVDLVSLAGGPDPDELNWYGGLGSAAGTLTMYGSDPVVETATGLDLQFRVPSASEQFRWYFDTTLELQLTGTALLPGTHLGLHLGATGTRFNEAWIENGRFGNVNVGGTTTGASGDGIFTSGVVVGYDAAPAADQLRVGDASFRMWFDGTDPYLYFDTTGGNDYLVYDRSANNFSFAIGGAAEVLVAADGIRVLKGLYVGSIGTPATDNDIYAQADISCGGNVDCVGDMTAGSITMSGFSVSGVGAAIAASLSTGAGAIDCGSLDVSSGGITNAGAIGCTSLNAGSGTIQTTGGISSGSLNAGSGTIQTTGGISAGSLNAGSGLIQTTGGITAGGTVTCDQLYLDGVSEGRITYGAGIDQMKFYVANVESLRLHDTGLAVLKGLRVGDLSAPTDDEIHATQNITAGGASGTGRIGRDTTTNYISWHATLNDLSVVVGSVEHLLVAATGLRVSKGLHVGSNATAATDNNITADGDITADNNVGATSYRATESKVMTTNFAEAQVATATATGDRPTTCLVDQTYGCLEYYDSTYSSTASKVLHLPASGTITAARLQVYGGTSVTWNVDIYKKDPSFGVRSSGTSVATYSGSSENLADSGSGGEWKTLTINNGAFDVNDYVWIVVTHDDNTTALQLGQLELTITMDDVTTNKP